MVDLKMLRVCKGMTQDQIAAKIGVDQSAYSKLESKGIGLTVLKAKKLGALLGFDWWLLFEEDESEKPVSVFHVEG